MGTPLSKEDLAKMAETTTPVTTPESTSTVPPVEETEPATE
jgi:hypothetical protein